MNVDLLIKENKELSEEKQRYKEMWFNANNSLAKYRDLEEQLGCPLYIVAHLVMYKPFYYEDENGDLHKIDCYDLCNKGLIFYMSWKDVDIYLGENGDIEIPLSDYKKSFWLKEDKSE